MPQPTTGSVHISAPLTNISVAYMQDQSRFIATKVFPIVPVGKQTDKYYKYTKADWFRDEAQRRAPATESEGSGYGITSDSYSCDIYAFHKDVDDHTRKNADAGINLDADATRFVTTRLLIRQEKLWTADAFATSIWATDVTGGTDFVQWDDKLSDPIADVETGRRTILASTGYMPNKLVIGYDVYKALKHHPDILARIQYGGTAGQPAMVNTRILAEIFELEEVLVCSAIENTAVEGATATMAFIQGKHALLCYSTPTPGLMEPTAGYTFSWREVSGGLGADLAISKMRMDLKKADRVEGEIALDNKIVATDLGYFFASAVA